MTVMSKSIHDYLREHTKDQTTKWIKLACPFSIRPPPKKIGDWSFDNNFAIVTYNLRLVDSL